MDRFPPPKPAHGGFGPCLHDGGLGCVKRVRPALHDGLKLLHSGGAMRVCCVGVGHGAALAVAAGQAYRVGIWRETQQRLEGCRTALTHPRTGLPRVDGPSDVLLCVMAEHGYSAPPGWRGYCGLTEN